MMISIQKKTVSLAVLSAFALSLPVTAKEIMTDSSAAPINTSYQTGKGNSSIANTRTHLVTFDGTYGSTPIELIGVEDGFCYVEKVDKSTSTEELRLEIKNGKYYMYGTVDGTNPAITTLKGTVACATYIDRKTAQPIQIGDPYGTIQCSPGSCSVNSTVNYGEMAEATLLLEPLMTCPTPGGCVKERYTFEETSGSNRVPGTNKVSTVRLEPGEHRELGTMTLKLYNAANMFVDTKQQPYTLNVSVRHPVLSFTCNSGENCTANKTVAYGNVPTASLTLATGFSNCTGCSVRLKSISGNIGVNGTSTSQVVSAARDKNSEGTTSKSGVIRAELVDRNGRVMKSIDRTVKLNATVNAPSFGVECSPGSCASEQTRNYGTTASAKTILYGNMSSCTGCYLKFSQISGSGMKGGGNSRYVQVSRHGGSPGTTTHNPVVRVELMNSDNKRVRHADKRITATATVKNKPTSCHSGYRYNASTSRCEGSIKTCKYAYRNNSQFSFWREQHRSGGGSSAGASDAIYWDGKYYRMSDAGSYGFSRGPKVYSSSRDGHSNNGDYTIYTDMYKVCKAEFKTHTPF